MQHANVMQYTLGMTFTEVKMGHIGCLVGYLTSSDSGILDSGHLQIPTKRKSQKLSDGS